MKDSKDARKNAQETASKGRDKEETNIEILIHLVKNLTIEMSEAIEDKHIHEQLSTQTKIDKNFINRLIKKKPVQFKICTEDYVPTRSMH